MSTNENSRINTSKLAAVQAAAVLALGSLLLVLPTADACPMTVADKSAEVSVSLGAGVSAEIQMNFFEGSEEPGASTPPFCTASAMMPLSAFPSTSNRFTTADVAAAIREQVDAWEIDTCSLILTYENDTKVELEAHELCVTGTYGFSKSNFWSKESERTCWEPVEIEVLDFTMR